MNEQFSILDIAMKIAQTAHTGQERKDGSPYINHIKDVVERLGNDNEKAVGWLHDVLEDTEYTVESSQRR